MAVADSKGRVFGVSNLRVADISAFPLLPPGHPQATVCKWFARRICQRWAISSWSLLFADEGHLFSDLDMLAEKIAAQILSNNWAGDGRRCSYSIDGEILSEGFQAYLWNDWLALMFIVSRYLHGTALSKQNHNMGYAWGSKQRLFFLSFSLFFFFTNSFVWKRDPVPKFPNTSLSTSPAWIPQLPLPFFFLKNPFNRKPNINAYIISHHTCSFYLSIAK